MQIRTREIHSCFFCTVRLSSENPSRKLRFVPIKKISVAEISISCHDAMYSLSQCNFTCLNEKGEILCDFTRAVDLEMNVPEIDSLR